jgi:hypothetical protein
MLGVECTYDGAVLTNLDSLRYEARDPEHW